MLGKKIISILCCLCLINEVVHASHNLAGQITYKYLAPNTYEITLTTYTDPFARGVDRCNADIEIWGKQGNSFIKIHTIQKIPRENGPAGNCESPEKMGVFIRPKIKKNIYRTVFTFNGPGIFALRYFDIARVDNVKNMNNSGATAFYVETLLFNNPFIGINNSPLLLNDPLDDACTNKLWTHNPGAYDPDGDSLSFSLIPCQQYDPPNISAPIPVSNYQYPSAFGGSFSINPRTGLITWDKPLQPGVYNISILIKEFRNGRELGYVIRDMAIFVKPCFNDPPIIQTIKDTCVSPGQTLNFDVTVYDPNPFDSVYFYLNNAGQGNNGPFAVTSSPATFNPPVSFPITTTSPNSINLQFSWNVICDHIRPQFYQIDWYAHDNIGYDPTLAANHITTIQVVPTAVKNLNAIPLNRQILLTWDPHDCSNATGYIVYRSNFASGTSLDSICCKDDLTGLGYTPIATLYGHQATQYIDTLTTFQPEFCYRVVAFFGTVKSCPSPQICVPFKLDFPVMTNDSVDVTDAVNGSIFVSWAKPVEIDTNFYPRPYTYKLYRGTGFLPSNFTFVQSFVYEDTTFFDTGLNTVQNPFTYKVEVYDANNQFIAPSNEASSIYLTLTPLDKAMQLDWRMVVPWTNDSIQIWRSEDNINAPYIHVATVPGNYYSYKDKGLINGKTYCYYVLSFGKYFSQNLKNPIINASQKTCGIPIDMTPPCIPGRDSVLVSSDCERFQVFFQWVNPDTQCAGDIAYYSLYFQPAQSSTKELIYQGKDTVFIYVSPNLTIAGCFYMTATDTSGNTSPFSEPYCTDNCPLFVLPNIFSPNGDGINDFILPSDWRSIKSVKFWVYDRWGFLIHYSEDRTNLWDGTYKGKPVADGVYYYAAEIEVDKAIPFTIRRFGNFTVLK